MSKAYTLTTHGGRTVDMLTHMALLRVEEAVGYPLTIAQGSYNKGGVTASAGTHDGGGAVDIVVKDGDWARVETLLRKFGFAAFYRKPIPGLWGAHIHALLIGNRMLSPGAKWQVDEYLAGRSGLASRGVDTGSRLYLDRRFSWRMGDKRILRAQAKIQEARAILASGIRGYKGIQATRRALGQAGDLLPKIPNAA